MNRIYTILIALLYINSTADAQCVLSASIPLDTITCGDCINLNAFGEGQGVSLFSEDFNTGGFSPGWGSTPGAVNFTNPCSSTGVDGTTHAWMDNNTTVPRSLQSAAYNLSTAIAGVTICFDMLFSTQGDAAPCEGPDEPDEGVYLQYSTDGGATWNTIHYFDPNGGNDPTLVNWNNWCFQLPPAAITASTMIRWFQDNDSGQDYDHWGIDNVEIYINDPTYNITWSHDNFSYGVGSSGGTNPTAVCPTTTTTYNAVMTNGTNSCNASVTVNVKDPSFRISAAPDTTLCTGECANLNGEATVVVSEGGIKTYENNQLSVVTGGVASVNINITDLNMTNILAGSVLEVCINQFTYSGTQLCTNPFGGCPCNGSTITVGQTCNLDVSSFVARLVSPGGCTVELVPSGVATGGQYLNVCFVPSGGGNINGGGFPASGQWDPSQPLSNLDGCQANGVWTLEFDAGGGLAFGLGTFFGWSITFDDPEISYPATFSWSPTTGMTGGNTLNPSVCPPQLSGNVPYTLSATDANNCVTVNDVANILMDGCLLPVGLKNFQGQALEYTNVLNWELEENHPFVFYQIERSPDAIQAFRVVGTVSDESGQLKYVFEDKNPLLEGYYRLRAMTISGEDVLSPVQYLHRKDKMIHHWSSYWENKEQLRVEFESPDQDAVQLEIIDLLGRTLSVKTIATQQGENTHLLDFSNYPAGQYILLLKQGNQQQLQRIIKS